ncbi:ATP-binding protein [Dasania sp. GY-MA-18]|uniref:histidine kinase n=1 Tax=Dasania phycosphaerae TaxID=2950436 RepID=A0A9J6RHX1_9GAMM|nr:MULTISPECIES: ATP-binding protein [Dasania]MCR8921436.1 ATP-binding protein [Dasania sp. GY-MA-18]MCZ0863864.1 ATP-binding protein [Dasania phycosphaerae]MCZ0867592.1 ATP-binding protein [Dasania phycosphaerae]
MKQLSRLQLLLICLLLAVASQQLFSFMVRLIDEAHYARQRMDVVNQLGRFRLDLEQRLNSTFYITQGIEILISTLKLEGASILSQQDKIEAWAREATTRLPYINNVAISEAYTIRFAYPMEGNAAIIGHNYRDLPGQWLAVQRAVQSRMPVVAGPLQLIQGGTGIICRIPLFSHTQSKQPGKFVGIVSMVVDYQALLQSAGLNEAEKTLSIAMRGKDGLGASGDIFYGEDVLFNAENISQGVNFLGGEWLLAAKPKAGWSHESPYSVSLSVLGYLLSLLIAVLCYFAVRGMQLRIATVRDFNKTLEQRVAERTEQLSLAKSEAERANVAKSEFLAVMSHELRTPLNSILGLAQLVEAMDLGELQRAYIAKVVTSANLLLGLINNILSYTKVESGNMVLEPESIALADTLKKISDVFEAQATAKGLLFAIAVDDSVPEFIECDKGKLLQLLSNLCGNAIKFTERGQVKLSVHCVTKPEAADKQCCLRFVISDTGIGISEQDQQQIFKPFVQIDNSIARQYQGSGLGLSICQRFVTLMNGRIGVNSRPGQGSEFWFEIPVNEIAALPHNGHISSVQRLDTAVAQSLPLLQGMRVILAEDNPFNQTLAVALLNKVGLEVHVAENGLQVLELLENMPVHGVLMDIQMPQLDGLATTRRLRADSRFYDLPIIAMTANAMREDKQQVLAAGMNDFVAKPIDFEHLYAVLIKCLQREQQYPERV